MKWSDIKFPISTAAFNDYVPHRQPMAWIKSMTALEGTTGRAEVSRDPDLHIFDKDGNFRTSTAVELIAQAYAYTGVLISLRDLGPDTKPATKMFLAGFKDFQVSDEYINFPKVNLSKNLTVECTAFRALGPLTIVNGKILDSDGRVLASGQIKVFSE